MHIKLATSTLVPSMGATHIKVASHFPSVALALLFVTNASFFDFVCLQDPSQQLLLSFVVHTCLVYAGSACASANIQRRIRIWRFALLSLSGTHTPSTRNNTTRNSHAAHASIRKHTQHTV